VGKGVWIPVLGNVAAGIPIEAVEDIIDYEEIDRTTAAGGDFFGLRLKGHSMEPRMREGDVVIVRKQSDADTGDVAVVMVNGQDATVKKIRKLADGICLLPLNPAFEPMYYTAAEMASLPVTILGKVVELRAKF
jgi:repressor LexA